MLLHTVSRLGLLAVLFALTTQAHAMNNAVPKPDKKPQTIDWDAAYSPKKAMEAKYTPTATPNQKPIKADMHKAATAPSSNMLRGLVLIDGEDHLQDENTRKIYDIQVNRDGRWVQAVAFSDQVMARLLNTMPAGFDSEYYNQNISLALIDSIVASIKNEIRRTDKPFANVYAPPQTSNDGVIYIVVNPSHVGKITMEESHYFDTERLLKAVRPKPGASINIQVIEEDVRKLSIHPDRKMRANFEAGTAENTTDINLDIEEQKPWRIFGLFTNTGSKELDKEQYIIGGYHNNVWGLDHKFAYQYLMSADRKSLEAHNIQYSIPVDFYQNLSLSYARSETEATLLNGTFETEGTFQSLSGLYEYNDVGAYSLMNGLDFQNGVFGFGVDYKEIEGDIAFTLFGAPIDTGVGADTEIVNFVTKYDVEYTDPFDGAGNLGAELVFSPGGLTGRNDDADFAKAREGTDAQYYYLKASATRSTPIFNHVFPKKKPVLTVGASGQYTGDSLVGSERFVNSWTPGFRGYNPGSFSGDSGFNSYIQIETPFFPIWGNDYLDNQAAFILFADYAAFYNNAPNAGETYNEILGSIGASLNYKLNDTLSSELTYALDLTSKDDDDQHMLMYKLLLSY